MNHNWTVTTDQFLTRNEVQRLYSALRDAKDLALQRQSFLHYARDYYLLRTMLETGLRVFEIVALRVSDLRNGTLIVRNGKGGKKRNVLLAKGTQKMIAEFIRLKSKTLSEPVEDEDFLFLSERKRPYSTRGVRKRVKFWFSKIGVSSKLSCHACRHTFASYLIAAGVDLPTVRNNLGHSSLAITDAYSHSVNSELGDLELYTAQSSPFNGKRNN